MTKILTTSETHKQKTCFKLIVLNNSNGNEINAHIYTNIQTKDNKHQANVCMYTKKISKEMYKNSISLLFLWRRVEVLA